MKQIKQTKNSSKTRKKVGRPKKNRKLIITDIKNPNPDIQIIHTIPRKCPVHPQDKWVSPLEDLE